MYYYGKRRGIKPPTNVEKSHKRMWNEATGIQTVATDATNSRWEDHATLLICFFCGLFGLHFLKEPHKTKQGEQMDVMLRESTPAFSWALQNLPTVNSTLYATKLQCRVHTDYSFYIVWRIQDPHLPASTQWVLSTRCIQIPLNEVNYLQNQL